MVQTATCPLCEALCAILVDSDGEHIRSIRGDEDGPFSLGRCPIEEKSLVDIRATHQADR